MANNAMKWLGMCVGEGLTASGAANRPHIDSHTERCKSMVSEWDVAVKSSENTDGTSSEQTRPRGSRSRALMGLVVVLGLEILALAGTTVFLVLELLVDRPDSYASGVALAVVIAVATIWVVFIVIGVVRGQAWTKAAVVVLQILVGAVAIGSLQGVDARPDLGIALLVPAILALVLLFSKSVLAHVSERDDRAL